MPIPYMNAVKDLHYWWTKDRDTNIKTARLESLFYEKYHRESNENRRRLREKFTSEARAYTNFEAHPDKEVFFANNGLEVQADPVPQSKPNKRKRGSIYDRQVNG